MQVKGEKLIKNIQLYTFNFTLLTTAMVYIPLHGHSTFSFLEAIGTVKKIAQKVKKMDLSAIAITDYNGMYSAVQFYNLSKELIFKPII